MLVGGNPYQDGDRLSHTFTRQFSATVAPMELVWHMDHCDRYVTVLEGNGWGIQMDDCMPRILEVNSTVFIPKNTFHRLIKGIGNLTICIREV